MNHVPVRVPLPSVKNNSTARSPTLFRYLGRKGGLLPPCTYPFDNGGTGPPRKMLSHVPIAHARGAAPWRIARPDDNGAAGQCPSRLIGRGKIMQS